MKKFPAAILFFFCIFVFSAIPPASAHERTTAQQASEMDTEAAMRDFVLHVREHRELIRNYDEHADFRNAMRNSNGVWRHRDTYVITVNRSVGGAAIGDSFQSGDIVFFHGKHPSSGSGSLRNIAIFERLMTGADGAGEEAVCVQAQNIEEQKYGNHVCAVQTAVTSQTGAQNIVYTVAGFNHEPGEVDFSKVRCPDLGPGYFGETGTRPGGESFTRTRADMVRDEESLEDYVKTVEEHIARELAGVPADSAQGGFPPVRMTQLMPCWRDKTGPWRSGSIYFFIFTYTDKRFAIFNGHNPASQDTAFHVIDDNGLNIARAVLEELRKQDDTPGEGFLTYLWDDPSVDGDEVLCRETGFVPVASPLEDEGGDEDEQMLFCDEGGPIPGRALGTSVKRGYFMLTDFGIEGDTDYILGSGIYPRPHRGGGGAGGCAIASGSGNGLEVSAFGLFLITAVLFLATSGKSCPGEKLLIRGLRARRKDRCQKG
ncbi:MAG: hypothetical protein F4Y78_01740 [Candidatus Dadabacteria bacterium]|nr:hypothetical protein [Candidatus Dadabacteria bacterium]MYA48982.1 hypothetical protein [Candidatus Dadabacteria bacterium]MYF48377.1 hypothetical protein [Candidatus Dadabacteria bacterium]MYG82610.1 hypothetical protein [Candidatus Dadabacteria bacterium]MYK49216.1 hypothetical protein [Candidatus Dadabacteria bacterium]